MAIIGQTVFSPSGRIAHHTTKDAVSLLDFLRTEFQLETGRGEELLSVGAVYSDRQRCFCDRPIPAGTYLRVHLQPKRHRVGHIDWVRQIIHETTEFLVVNKPPMVPVHATVDNYCDNVLYEMRRATGLSLLVTQRIDIPTTGLIVFAKTPAFQVRFNRWLADRRVHKQYCALVRNSPPLGVHVHYMEKSAVTPKRVFSEPGDSSHLRCELEITHVTRPGNFYEVAINLHTGRTHQIRAQLSQLGFPLVGDSLYGDTGPAPDFLIDGQISLHAETLTWDRNLQRFTVSPSWR